ncbi:MAG: UvrD-helicase domain-containing protein [Firmicutes bacterium]|nr:UvrD-helicase domain-containing protein [Bacillota bacterium]
MTGEGGEGLDRAAREAVRMRIADAISLEAGAGTGKTTALVERVLALLAAGVPLTSLAVVTFLRAAGEELRVRLRERLGGREEAWAWRALADLAAAPVGTLHSLAQRLLAQEGWAGGWDPATRVLEEDEAEELSRTHFRRWLEEAARDSAPLAAARRLGAALSAPTLWRLAVSLPPDAVLPPPPPPLSLAPLAPFEASLASAEETFARVRSACRDGTDAALKAGEELGHARAELASWEGEERLFAALRLALPSPRAGRRDRWSPPSALDELRAALSAAQESQRRLSRAVGERVAYDLLAWLLPFAAHAEAERRRSGVADFDDLIRRAVSLLAGDGAVRARARARIRAVLVDEFQDTDPRQVELLTLLAGRPDDPPDQGVARLFAVGDPKQSIYRFRGADVATYLRVREAFPPSGRLAITRNFRARPALVETANRVMAPLFASGPIPYLALEGGREGEGPPPVQLLLPPDEAPPPAGMAELRRREADLVASHVRAALDAPWRVDGRPLAPGDIALLFPRRTAYGTYTAALERAGVPYAAGRDRGLWRRRAARDAVLLLRACARPRDADAVAAALHSSLVGVSDAEMAAFVRLGGRFDLAIAPPPGSPPLLVRAMAALGEAAFARHLPPARRLAALFDALDVATAAGLEEGEAGVRAVMRVLETVRALQARAGDGEPASLDRVADALAAVGWEGEEGDLPDPAEGAEPTPPGGRVRLMTVHEAKGNEFAVVVLCDLWSPPPPPRGPRVLLRPEDRLAALSLGARGPFSPGAEELAAVDGERQAEERVRLLYVALTRARSALVLPDGRASRPDGRGRGKADESMGGLILRAADGKGDDPAPSLADALVRLGVPVALFRPRPVAPVVLPPLPAADLTAPPRDLAALRARLARRALPLLRPSEAAPAAEAGTAAGGGREREAAARLGRAVHAVVASALAAAGGTEDLSARAAREAAQAGLGAAEVEALARAALFHPLVRRAAAAPMRAVEADAVARLADGSVVLGRVDLVFDDGEGPILVDLKTDRLPAPDAASAARHGERYGYDAQLRLYAAALAEAGLPAPYAAYVLYVRHGLAVPVPLAPAAGEARTPSA